MHQRQLLCLQLFVIVDQHVQKLNGVHREVHVDVIWQLELDREGGVLFVDLSHGLASTHVPADHPLLHLVEFGVGHQVLVTVGVEVVGDHEEVLLGCPHCEGTHSAEDISQQLPRPHDFQQAIPLLLQSGAPVYFFEVDLELYSSLFESGFIVDFPSHVFQGRSPIDVVQFLSLVGHCFDVGALQESDLSDDVLPLLLIFSQIVMCDVPNGLETPREMDVVGLLGVLDFGEPVELLLVIVVFMVQLHIVFSDFIVVLAQLLLESLQVFCPDVFSEKDHFGVSAGSQDSGVTK
jgi:hypothetical protein